MLCEELPHVCTCTPEKESQSSLRAIQYDVVNLWQSLTKHSGHTPHTSWDIPHCFTVTEYTITGAKMYSVSGASCTGM